MKLNLDAMRSEIQEYLETHGLTVFHASPQAGEHTSAVYWDTEHHTDYRDFVAAAQAAEARLVTLQATEFSDDVLDDAMDRLELSALPRDERRAIEMRLRELRGYIGFTCQIELSFDVSPRVYIFDMHTEWFDDLNDLLDRIDDAYEAPEAEDPLGGGYFSKN